MGKLPKGVMGPLIGKVGGITGYLLHGENVTRALPAIKRKAVGRQRDNCQRMAVLNDFFYHMKYFLKAGFHVAAAGTNKNYYNLAIIHNKSKAVKGEFPDMEMDYPKVIFSYGKLEGAINPRVTLAADGLSFNWDTTPEMQYNLDQVMILVYLPELKKSIGMVSGARRPAGTEFLPVPSADYLKSPMEVYISFTSDDRQDVAISQYIGRIN